MNGVVRSNERVLEVQERVARLKCHVRELQVEVAEAKQRSEGQWPRGAAWRDYERRKLDWNKALKDLSDAKLELSKLSGTTGVDPRWMLLCEAWHVLNELEERGIELGARADALIEDIEFHVPHAKLHATTEGKD